MYAYRLCPRLPATSYFLRSSHCDSAQSFSVCRFRHTMRGDPGWRDKRWNLRLCARLCMPPCGDSVFMCAGLEAFSEHAHASASGAGVSVAQGYTAPSVLLHEQQSSSHMRALTNLYHTHLAPGMHEQCASSSSPPLTRCSLGGGEQGKPAPRSPHPAAGSVSPG